MPEALVLFLPPAEDPFQVSAEEWRFRAARRLGLRPADLAAVRVERVSFDARRRHMEWRVALRAWRRGQAPPPEPPTAPPAIPQPPADAPRVAVVGAGPAGLFAALDLLQAGCRVVLLERGRDVQARRRDVAALNRGEPADPDSNYCFGEGGAGAYSDGKLYTRSGRREEVRRVLETLVAHGAPPEVLVSWRPHVGSNRLPKVVAALRETLRRGGAEILWESRVVAILTEEAAPGPPAGPGPGTAPPRRVRGVALASGRELAADAVVLATGHSALDALEMARAAGARLAPKGFAMGFRVEHPQAWVDAWQYHGARDTAPLPPAFYELTARAGDRGVYTFCMCPGGWIVPCQVAPWRLVVNGMSLARRDSPFANSGVVVELRPEDWCGRRGGRWGWPEVLRRAAQVAEGRDPLLAEPGVAAGRLPDAPEDDPLFGVRLQHALEVLAAAAGGGGNRAPAQRLDDFVTGRGAVSPLLPTSYRPGLTPADFADILPRGMVGRLREGLRAFARKMPGFTGPDGQAIGVETRTSSPVRILRDRETRMAEGVAGLFPAGEGAGQAGGIVSAALDGRRAAAGAAVWLLRRRQNVVG